MSMTKKEYLERKIKKLQNGEYKINEIEKIKELVKHHQKILDKIE